MPISKDFENRLTRSLTQIADHFGTPFHLYDEQGIRETGTGLIKAFAGIHGFKEYFAVKALPNPRILQIMRSMGFGFDCSSIAELRLSRDQGASGEEIMFTSNDTSQKDFAAAEAAGGCVLNLDDISLIDKVPHMPELICFRYNPGAAAHRQQHHRQTHRGQVRRRPRAAIGRLSAGSGSRGQTFRPAHHGRLE